jgi:hypothetical protein
MAQKFTNNAISTLASSIIGSDLTIALNTGDGAKFPNPTGGDFFYATLYGVSGSTEINHEIVKVTARSTDSLTVVRAQDGTTARSWIAGSPFELRVTSATLGGFVQAADHQGDIVLGGTGRRIKADFSNATNQTNRCQFQTTTANGSTVLGVIPNGTGNVTAINLWGGSDPDNAANLQLIADEGNTIASISANKVGTGTFRPLRFMTSGTERMRIATDGSITHLKLFGQSTEFANTLAAGAFSFDPVNGCNQSIFQNANTTATLLQAAQDGVYTCRLRITPSATGWTFTWAAGTNVTIVWAGGAGPTISQTANTIITFYVLRTGGTTFYFGAGVTF